MNFTDSIRENFNLCAKKLFQQLQRDEQLMLNLNAEQSTFVRWNKTLIRQNTNVHQVQLSLELHKHGKTQKRSFSITGHSKEDVPFLLNQLSEMRLGFDLLPEDPHQIVLRNNGQSEVHPGKEELQNSPSLNTILHSIGLLAKNIDLAGLLCLGPLIRANKNSLGQDHWFATVHFFFDYSIYDGTKAVKGNYSGKIWNDQDFLIQLKTNIQYLNYMSAPIKKINPGRYKAYLAPSAVAEICGLMSWGALSYHNYKTSTCAFKKLADQQKKLSNKLTLKENFSLGWSPRFNSLGELSQNQVRLIEQGQLKQFLVSAKSAKEFSAHCNHADPSEAPRSLEILPGHLQREHIFAKLDTGLYLSDLHYLNWSDEANARFTGMTRFACFWIEKGQIVAPIQDMRFDDHLYNIFGINLLEFTDFQQLMPEVGTYGQRSMGAKNIPGLLLQEFNLTL
jgi:hypothetical protein